MFNPPVKSRVCKACGAKAVKVIYIEECNVPGTSEKHKKRRLECTECKARTTTREISEELFQQLLKDSSSLLKIFDAVQNVRMPVNIPCHNCGLNEKDKCDIDLPEFMTAEAVGCSCFKKAS